MIIYTHTDAKNIGELVSQAEILHLEVKMAELSNIDLPYCEQISLRSYLLSGCFKGNCWVLFLLSQKSEQEKLASAVFNWAKGHTIIARQKIKHEFLMIELQHASEYEVFRMCEQLSPLFGIRCDM